MIIRLDGRIIKTMSWPCNFKELFVLLCFWYSCVKCEVIGRSSINKQRQSTRQREFVKQDFRCLVLCALLV